MNKFGSMFVVIFLIMIVVSSIVSLLIGINVGEKNSVPIIEKQIEEMPEWLKKDYRAVEAPIKISQPVINFVESVVETPIATKAIVIPVVQEKIPSWEVPGSMELMAKMQMDDLIWHYKRFDCKVAELKLEYKENKITEVQYDKLLKDLREEHCRWGKTLIEAANHMGLDIYKEYGVTIRVPCKCCKSLNWWENTFDKR